MDMQACVFIICAGGLGCFVMRRPMTRVCEREGLSVRALRMGSQRTRSAVMA